MSGLNFLLEPPGFVISIKDTILSHKIKIGLGVSVITAGVLGMKWYSARRKRQNFARVIDTITELQSKNIYIADRDKVEDIVCRLIEGGKDKLQVVMDFDMTITKFWHGDGVRNVTCHGVIDMSPLMPAHYRDAFTTIRNTYYPIEISHSMSVAEKLPYMVEWWTKAHNLMLECDITRDKLKEMVRLANCLLRDGSMTLFRRLCQANVPLLVFSAGVGDVLEEILKQQDHFFDNMKIVSNWIDFNHEGRMVGFTGDIIHAYNKSESAIRHSGYFDRIAHRHNVVLVGDTSGDIQMARGVQQPANILNVGFLNDKVDQRLQQYLDTFDIVIVQDETMDVVNAIMKRIL